MFLGLRGILDGGLLRLLDCFNDGLLDSDILGLLLDDDRLLLDDRLRGLADSGLLDDGLGLRLLLGGLLLLGFRGLGLLLGPSERRV